MLKVFTLFNFKHTSIKVLPSKTTRRDCKKELEDSTVKYVCNYTHSQEHLDWKTEALRIVFTSNNLHFDRTILYTVNQCTLTQYCNISMFVIFSQKIEIVSQNNKNEWKVSFLCDVSVLRIGTCMWWQTNTHHRQQDRHEKHAKESPYKGHARPFRVHTDKTHTYKGRIKHNTTIMYRRINKHCLWAEDRVRTQKWFKYILHLSVSEKNPFVSGKKEKGLFYFSTCFY